MQGAKRFYMTVPRAMSNIPGKIMAAFTRHVNVNGCMEIDRFA